MSLMSILEKLATTVQHDIDLDNLLSDQPLSVKRAFLKKSSQSLRAELDDDAAIPAHRSSVVSINT